MYNKESPKKKDRSLFWFVVIVLIIYFFGKTTGCNVLSSIANYGQDSESAYEIIEDKASQAKIESIPCSGVFSDGLGTIEQYDNCIRELTKTAKSSEAIGSVPQNSSGCPDGCDYHKAGCDIKGNIGFSSKEKIYHLPGMEFYDETKIDPSYGERWFCTESEAIANGWRKSKSE